MKLLLALRKLWSSLPAQTWTETYAAIFTLLLIFLGMAYACDFFKAALP